MAGAGRRRGTVSSHGSVAAHGGGSGVPS
ncbi:MAG: hypothetical protein QOC86_1934, partial [Gaiellales bacterium]|nr:hypothetical protein [Gaiellales bacterium]